MSESFNLSDEDESGPEALEQDVTAASESSGDDEVGPDERVGEPDETRPDAFPCQPQFGLKRPSTAEDTSRTPGENEGASVKRVKTTRTDPAPLQRFLARHICKRNEAFTHLSIKGYLGGKFAIPDDAATRREFAETFQHMQGS
jgi:hypothetical protein